MKRRSSLVMVLWFVVVVAAALSCGAHKHHTGSTHHASNVDDDNDDASPDDDDDVSPDDDDDNDDDDNDNDDNETVWTDPATSLMWQNGAAVGSTSQTFANATTYCDGLHWGGYYSGWRLPNIDELRSLIARCADEERGGSCGVIDGCDTSCWSSSLCGGGDCSGAAPFWQSNITGVDGHYWSSSTYGGGLAWVVYFDVGGINGSWTDDSTDHDVRCVRGTLVDDDDDDNDDDDTCNADTCPNGCCSGTTCVPQTNNDACGANGAACISCGAGAECVAVAGGGACVCDATSCSDGCCSGLTCVPQTNNTACGANGDSCVACDAGLECVAVSGGGACMCDTNSCAGCCDAFGVCQDVSVCWTDPTTGHIWQNGTAGGKMSQSDAATYCAFLPLAGYTTGWQLPDIDQLRSLIRGCAATVTGGSCGVTDNCLNAPCWSEACMGCDKLGGPAPGGAYWPPEISGTISWYWSFSPDPDDSGYSYGVDFRYGAVGSDWSGDATVYVRCVRP